MNDEHEAFHSRADSAEAVEENFLDTEEAQAHVPQLQLADVASPGGDASEAQPGFFYRASQDAKHKYTLRTDVILVHQ